MGPATNSFGYHALQVGRLACGVGMRAEPTPLDKSALLGRRPGSVGYLSMPANLLAESLADCLMDADWEYQPMEILQASPEPPPWAAE